MLHQLSTLLNELAIQFHNIPAGFWQALLASGILSPFLKGLKHWLSVESEKVMFGLVLFVSAVVAFGAYLLNAHPDNPQIIVLHTAILAFMTQPFYFYLVKPLWGILGQQFGAAAKFNAELRSAAIPAEGLPIAGTSVSAPDPSAALKNSLETEDFSS